MFHSLLCANLNVLKRGQESGWRLCDTDGGRKEGRDKFGADINVQSNSFITYAGLQDFLGECIMQG